MTPPRHCRHCGADTAQPCLTATAARECDRRAAAGDSPNASAELIFICALALAGILASFLQ